MDNSSENGGDTIATLSSAERGESSSGEPFVFSPSAYAILEAAWIFYRHGDGSNPLSSRVETAVLNAAIMVGSRDGTNSSARWLFEWLKNRQERELDQWLKRQPRIGESDWRRLTITSAAPRPNGDILALAADLLRRADDLASRTVPSKRRISGRQLIALFLVDIPQTMELLDAQIEFQKQFGVRLTEFRTEFLDGLMRNPTRGETEEAWRAVLEPVVVAEITQDGRSIIPDEHYRTSDEIPDGLRGGGRGPAIEGAPEAATHAERADPRSEARFEFLPAFAADGSSGVDQLGVSEEARIFARMICLDKARPPLSIGLFGEWGSGKSFFMRKIQEGVSNLREERKQRREQAKKALANDVGRAVDPFVTNVVQLRFNAWSYADGDVWASLTAEFFDQLRVGGFDGRDGAMFERLIDLVSHDIQSAEGTLAESTRIAETKKQEAADQERMISELEQQKAELEATVLGVVANDILKSMLAKPETGKTASAERAKIEKAGEAIGRPGLADSLEALRSEVEAASGVPGKVALILRSVAHGGWKRLVFATLAVVLAAVAVSVSNWGAANYWTASATRFVAMLGSLGIAMGVVRDGYLRVKPLLDITDRFFERLKTEQEKLEANLKAADQALSTARKAEAEARLAAAKATQRLTLLPGSTTAGSKATLLRYFLFDAEETRGFDKTLGVVSRARRAFETLDVIIRDYRDYRTLRDESIEAARAGGQLEADKAARLERLTPKYSGIDADNDAEIPDRVVLYIDDLDRCRTDQVVKVLEAVHLLLAFESFVVVVGVDVRWTSAALVEYYSGQLSLEPGAANARRRATPDDYLEKIFQIPFWLRPISVDPTDGTLSRLVRNVAGEPAKDNVSTGTDDRNGSQSAHDAPAGSDEPSRGRMIRERADLVEPAASTATLVDRPLSPVDVVWTPAEERELVLTAPEHAVFEAVGPLIARSPRAVKRFVNSYRIIRDRFRGADLDAFTADISDAPFVAVALLLAIEVGMGQASRDRLIDDITKPGPSPSRAASDEDEDGSNGFERYMMARSRLNAIDRQPSADHLKAYAPLVSRFSFHGPLRHSAGPN